MQGHCPSHGFKHLDPTRQRPQEGFLLTGNDLRCRLPRLGQLRERLAHLPHQCGQERRYERLADAERLVAVADRAAQDPAEHVAAARVARQRPVRDGDGEGADVVGHDAHRHADALVVGVRLVVVVVRLQAGRLGDGRQDGREEVRVVVGRLALEHRADALEAHARVDVLVRQRRQHRLLAVLGRVELDEHQVPDLHDPRVVLVDELLAGRDGPLVVVAQVDVDLRARPARPGLAHHPEVVLRRLVEDVGRVDGGLLGPEVGRLGVRPEAERLVALVDGDVEAVGVEAPAVDEQLPGPGDGLALEVVPEAPVAEHLEERMVVRVEADLVEVVVLAGDAQALLSVRHADVRAGARPEKDVLERVHARVDEQQCRVVLRDDGRAGHDLVAFLAEEGEEGVAGLLGGLRAARHTGVGRGTRKLPRPLPRGLPRRGDSV